MGIQDQRVPLFAGQPCEHRAFSLDLFPVLGSAIEIGAGVAGIAQDLRMFRFLPLPFPWGCSAAGKAKPLLTEHTHDAESSADTPKGLEQQTKGLLHLLVRIEHDPTSVIISQAQG